MSNSSVCPATRLLCRYREICWLLHCTKGLRLRPIPERDLTKAELYAFEMDKRRNPPKDDVNV